MDLMSGYRSKFFFWTKAMYEETVKDFSPAVHAVLAIPFGAETGSRTFWFTLTFIKKDLES